jgi:hypothetical protein
MSDPNLGHDTFIESYDVDRAIVITVHGGFEVIAYDARTNPPRLLVGVPIQESTPENVTEAIDVILAAVRTQLVAQLTPVLHGEVTSNTPPDFSEGDVLPVPDAFEDGA